VTFVLFIQLALGQAILRLKSPSVGEAPAAA
jgi:hypothetical protein